MVSHVESPVAHRAISINKKRTALRCALPPVPAQKRAALQRLIRGERNALQSVCREAPGATQCIHGVPHASAQRYTKRKKQATFREPSSGFSTPCPIRSEFPFVTSPRLAS